MPNSRKASIWFANKLRNLALLNEESQMPLQKTFVCVSSSFCIRLLFNTHT